MTVIADLDAAMYSIPVSNYLAPLKTERFQPLCSPQDLLQWQLVLAPCEAHLHLHVTMGCVH